MTAPADSEPLWLDDDPDWDDGIDIDPACTTSAVRASPPSSSTPSRTSRPEETSCDPARPDLHVPPPPRRRPPQRLRAGGIVTTIRYAWCFSHGRMHRFDGEPWCTARWVAFTATTETDAHAAKHRLYGDARFLHELVPEVQLEVLHTRQARKART